MLYTWKRGKKYNILVVKPKVRSTWKTRAEMGGWDQNRSYGDWLWGHGVNLPGSS
jgi:hypothetical protein